MWQNGRKINFFYYKIIRIVQGKRNIIFLFSFFFLLLLPPYIDSFLERNKGDAES